MDNGASSYRRFLDGDEGAFDKIMKELFHKLVFFVNGYVNDIQAAEDISIDVFSELIVHRGKYNFRVSLKTYLFMRGRSKALDYIKHRKVRSYVELSQLADQSDGSPDPEMIFLDGEKNQIIHSALKNLSTDMRTVIHLIYFEDMTYDQAAKIMKKSRKQIDNLLYRAKKELRAILGKDGELLI